MKHKPLLQVKRIIWQITALSAALILCFPAGVKAASKPYAEWCQCAIFAVNHLGLEIIPGDYYTAGSFIIPDESGRTWMEYQGFDQRAAEENPERGDVVVIRPNGKVYIPDGSETTRLTTVNVDAWAGHIGVVESVQPVSMDGRDYWQTAFLSSNWGVNATPMFVRSGCFNVDRSQVFIERGDVNVSFWRESDVRLQRQHIVNIATQLANGYYHVGSDQRVDGYPISGEGLLAYSWRLDWPAEQTFVDLLNHNSREIPLSSIEAGDILVTTGPGDKSFHGIYAGWKPEASGVGLNDWFGEGLVYWFDPAANSLQGPAEFKGLLEPEEMLHLRAYRHNALQPLLELEDLSVEQSKDGAILAGFVVRNAGGQVLRLEESGVEVSTLQGGQIQAEGAGSGPGVEITAGHEFVVLKRFEISKSGVYFIQPFVKINGVKKALPEEGQVVYLLRR